MCLPDYFPLSCCHSGPIFTSSLDTLFCAPTETSKLSRLLFGLIVRVVTWVELRGYPSPDVPLTSAWVSSWVHQGVVATGKTSPPLFLPTNPHLSPPPLYPRLVPLSTPGGLKRISPVLTLQEPATSQPRISPNLWSTLPVAQVTVTSLQIWQWQLTWIVISHKHILIWQNVYLRKSMIFIEYYLLVHVMPWNCPEYEIAVTLNNSWCRTPLLCVSEISDAVGQGYCQGGFSADFTTVITMFLFVNHQRFLG